jgi:hypothetical protein
MDGDLAVATETRPGTKFFAPQVRLVTEDGEPITIEDQPVSPDIISATVTLLNSGVGQVDVVLNNQRHNDANRPVVPVWRYNKLDTLSFGKRMRVDFRYGNDGWTPMMLARITDVAFDFPAAEGAKITLKGEDLVSLLKAKPEMDEMYIDFHEIDMVELVLSSSNSGLSLPADRPQNAFSTVLPSITHEKAKSFLQFIQAFAERMDYEVFVAFDNPEPGRAAPNPVEADPRSVSFHFEPSRSATVDDVVALQWGRDIVDFKPKLKVWDILTAAEASGSVPRGRGGLTVTVPMSDAINDLQTADGGPTPMSVADFRASEFDEENRPEANVHTITATNIDEERARMHAKAALRKSAREFLTADITTIGFTRLRPGIHVNLTGLYAPFDGIYYVAKTVHTLTAAGYITKTSLNRPGMLDPDQYPTEA